MQSVEAAGLTIGDEAPPRIMGVLNVSEESPYDPSVFSDPGEAARYVDRSLIDEGADIVDVGLESANKRLSVLSAEEELARLETACEAIASVSGDAVFSIETRYAEVAAAALSRGFDMVNDVCGFADPDLPDVCEAHEAAVVKMASPPDLERPGAVETMDWASHRDADWAASADHVDKVCAALADRGLTDKTIVDPAFGGWSEAATLAQDRKTFRRLPEVRSLERPVLVSINRKNFLGDLVDRPTEERLPVSLAATALAVQRGVHVIRTHDVAETSDAAIGADALTDDWGTVVDGIRFTRLPSGFGRNRPQELAALPADTPRVAVQDPDGTVTERLRTHANADGVVAVDVDETLVVGGDRDSFDQLLASLEDRSALLRGLETVLP